LWLELAELEVTAEALVELLLCVQVAAVLAGMQVLEVLAAVQLVRQVLEAAAAVGLDAHLLAVKTPEKVAVLVFLDKGLTVLVVQVRLAAP
jgi:hypothetical protein